MKMGYWLEQVLVIMMEQLKDWLLVLVLVMNLDL